MKFTLLLMALALTQVVSAYAAGSLYEIPLKDIDGKATSLKAYKGKVMLIVNVASQCGYTPQYQGLEAIQQKYQAKGFSVLGFPCNDFGSQEPGSPAEIKSFCSKNYQVTFPLFAKIHIVGKDKHPLYEVLSGKESPFPGDVSWNFGKFLIGKDGRIVKRFESDVEPESAELAGAIEAALAEK